MYPPSIFIENIPSRRVVCQQAVFGALIIMNFAGGLPTLSDEWKNRMFGPIGSVYRFGFFRQVSVCQVFFASWLRKVREGRKEGGCGCGGRRRRARGAQEVHPEGVGRGRRGAAGREQTEMTEADGGAAVWKIHSGAVKKDEARKKLGKLLQKRDEVSCLHLHANEALAKTGNSDGRTTGTRRGRGGESPRQS